MPPQNIEPVRYYRREPTYVQSEAICRRVKPALALPTRYGRKCRDLSEIPVGIKAVHGRDIRHMHAVKPTVRNNRGQHHALPIDELCEADSLCMTHGGWAIPISEIDGRSLIVDAAQIREINDAIHSGRTHGDALKIGPTGDYE